jgi:hypothetical protein
MRRGLDQDLFLQNVETYLRIVPKANISFMCTYNILCGASFRPFLEKILELRDKWGKERIGFDTPYLKEPPHWMINLLPPEWVSYIDEDLDFIKQRITPYGMEFGFNEHEWEKLKRVRNYFVTGGPRITPELIETGRKDFYKFFSEYDKRSPGLNLIETFPEYKDFYHMCKELTENAS